MSDGQPAKRGIEVRYEVKKPFKYGGENLKPGDEFVPLGAPHDAKLINQGKYVTRIEAAVTEAEDARRKVGRPRKGADSGK